jgi:hypothetical protein
MLGEQLRRMILNELEFLCCSKPWTFEFSSVLPQKFKKTKSSENHCLNHSKEQFSFIHSTKVSSLDYRVFSKEESTDDKELNVAKFRQNLKMSIEVDTFKLWTVIVQIDFNFVNSWNSVSYNPFFSYRFNSVFHPILSKLCYQSLKMEMCTMTLAKNHYHPPVESCLMIA